VQPCPLRAGQKPPQFVIVSFDGAGDHQKWAFWRDVARRSGMRFTGFLSGVYLLDRATAPTTPVRAMPPGTSSLGGWNTPAEVRTLIKDLDAAYAAGMEIGTHYNGHFCTGAEPSANAWTTADWSAELAQFFRFWRSHRDLTVPASSVRGGRTPVPGGPARAAADRHSRRPGSATTAAAGRTGSPGRARTVGDCGSSRWRTCR
jgi:hypothetical protein